MCIHLSIVTSSGNYLEESGVYSELNMYAPYTVDGDKHESYKSEECMAMFLLMNLIIDLKATI